MSGIEMRAQFASEELENIIRKHAIKIEVPVAVYSETCRNPLSAKRIADLYRTATPAQRGAFNAVAMMVLEQRGNV